MKKNNPLIRCLFLFVVLIGLMACGLFAPTASFPNLLWTFDAQESRLQFSQPVVVNGVVYLAGMTLTEGHSGRLVALDEATGAVKWDVTYEEVTMGAPIVQGDLVLVTERQGSYRSLLAVEAANGQVRWRGPQLRGTPVTTEKLVWLVAGDNHLVALDLADGSQRFSRAVGPDTAGSLLLADGIIYLGDPDGELLALDAVNGNLLWQAAAEPRMVYDPPVVAQGLVFLDAPLTAYDAKTGAVRWTSAHETDGHTPALFGETLYVRGFPDNDTVHALDAQSGVEKWAFNVVDSDSFITWLAVENSNLYTLAKNDVYALDPETGAVKWAYNLPRYPGEDCLVEFMAGPVVLDGVVFVDAKIEQLSDSCSKAAYTSQIRLDAGTGQLLSETKAGTSGFEPETIFGLQAINGQVYQNSSGKLYVMKAR
jgi:outer membrane protein assembly factor BamB